MQQAEPQTVARGEDGTGSRPDSQTGAAPPMRLLFATLFNPYGPKAMGGAETSIRLMAEQFAARGHHAVYLTRVDNAAEAAAARAAGVRLVPFWRLRRGGALRRPVNTLLALLHCLWLLRRGGFQGVYVYYERPLMRALLLTRRIARLTGGGKGPPIMLRMAGMRWKEEIEAGGAPVKRQYEAIFRAMDSLNFIHPDLLPMTRTALADLGMSDRFRDILVADIGSALTAGRATPYAALPARPFRMVMATRFSDYQKRQDILVRGLAHLPPGLDWHLTLVGSGPRRAESEALVAAQGLGERVTFLPFLAQDRLWQMLREMHLMCHSVEYEGLSKILLEAMAAGLPVLVSDVVPLNGYVSEGVNGFLCPNTPEDWGRRIGAIAADAAARARVSQGGMDFVRTEYDPARNVRAYEDRFRALAAAVRA